MRIPFHLELLTMIRDSRDSQFLNSAQGNDFISTITTPFFIHLSFTLLVPSKHLLETPDSAKLRVEEILGGGDEVKGCRELLPCQHFLDG